MRSHIYRYETFKYSEFFVLYTRRKILSDTPFLCTFYMLKKACPHRFSNLRLLVASKKSRDLCRVLLSVHTFRIITRSDVKIDQIDSSYEVWHDFPVDFISYISIRIYNILMKLYGYIYLHIMCFNAALKL